MKSRSCKSKGRRLVMVLRKAVLAAFPHLHPDDIQPVPTSVGGIDLKLSPAARKCWPWSTECKNVEKLNIWAAIQQAEANADGHAPAVVLSRNRMTQPWVAIPLDAMVNLLHELMVKQP